ncbi:MAG TPA: hypothetical protein VGB17_05310 [Pyrinomonadaceae bacterium]|jgi:hypothetical protein
MMDAYFARVRPTYIENWTTALLALSIQQIDLPLTLEEARALGLVNREFSRWFGGGSIDSIEGIAKRIDAALCHYPEGAFIRLGSRSGKDSSYAHNRGLRVTDGHGAIRLLTENSYRIAYDLRLALHHKYRPHIFVRRWLEIPPWSEFRCFMKGRKLVGISQYDCRNLGHCALIATNAERIKAAIGEFFKAFSASSHLDDVVFDVFVVLDEHDSHGPASVRLLELNPFFQKTDACLFDWTNGGDFDGSFRFL